MITSIRLLKNGFQHKNIVKYMARNYQLSATNGNKSENSNLKSIKDIPGPKPLPILGNVLDFVKNEKKQHWWFKELYETYGDIIKIDLGLSGFGNMIYTFNPEYAKIIFTAEGSMPHNFVLDNFIWYRNVRKKELFPDGFAGLAGSYPELWREQRTAINPNMMRRNAAVFYLEAEEEISSDCVDRIAEKRDDKNEITNGVPEIIYLWSLESIAKIFLDTRLGCLDREMDPKCAEFIENVHALLQGSSIMLRKLPLWKYIDVPHYKKFDKAFSYLYRESSILIKKSIKHHKENKENLEGNQKNKNSILTKLTDKFGEDSNIPIVTALDALIGGVDSVATTATFLLYHLANNPPKQEIAIKEVDRIVGSGKITQEKVDQLHYMKACLVESQRINPAANGTARRLQNDIVLGEYLIPKGTYVVLTEYVSANDPKNFPEPEIFLPERWLRGHLDHNKAHPYAHIPFGFGQRMCVGRRFAEMEVLILAVKMLQKFRMEYHHEPVDMNFEFVNHADIDIRIKLIEKS